MKLKKDEKVEYIISLGYTIADITLETSKDIIEQLKEIDFIPSNLTKLNINELLINVDVGVLRKIYTPINLLNSVSEKEVISLLKYNLINDFRPIIKDLVEKSYNSANSPESQYNSEVLYKKYLETLETWGFTFEDWKSSISFYELCKIFNNTDKFHAPIFQRYEWTEQNLKDLNLLLSEGILDIRKVKALGISATTLKKANIPAAILWDNRYNNKNGGEGYSASQLKTGGYSAKDIYGGYSDKGIYTASNFTIADLKNAEYSIKDLLSAGYKEDQIIYGNWSSVLNLKKPYIWGRHSIENPTKKWGYSFEGQPKDGFTQDQISAAKVASVE